MAIAKVILNGETLMDVTSDTATANNMLSGIKATKNDGTKATGNIASKSSTDLSVSGATVTAPAGYYASAASKAVTAGSAFPPAVTITKAPTIGVNTSGVVTASYNGSSSITPTITSGYISQGTAGTISTTGTSTYQLTSQAAATYYPSTADQTIASQRWLVGNQTIKSVTTSNLTAENIAEGVVVKVGDSANASRITQITGTHKGGGYTCTVTNGSTSGRYIRYNEEVYTSGEVAFYKDEVFNVHVTGNSSTDAYLYINNKLIIGPVQTSIDYNITPNVDFSVKFTSGNNASRAYITIPEIDITENGQHEVGGYGYANVDVSSPGEGFTIDQIAMHSISGDISGNATLISTYAFYGCSSLTTANFPSCSSIGDNAFYNCTNLTTVSFPLCSVISSYAFENCFSLTTASFPSCGIIDYYAFYNCYGLTTVSFPLCSVISTAAFFGCYGLSTASFPAAQIIYSSAFRTCSGLTTVSFPLCSDIRGYAFYYCPSLTAASFPSCRSIGIYAFYSCTHLTTVSFPVTQIIYASAFYGCSSLTTANFPSCSSIGACAFYRCYRLTTASFPAAQIIYASAFTSCYNLVSLYLLGSFVVSLSNSNAFVSTPISNYTTSTGGVYGSIFVPASLYSEYITATNWSVYSARIVSV